MAIDMTELVEITSESELRSLLGEPTPAAADKARKSLHEHHREWLAQSPFCVIATADGNGWCDASPKGDPAGFAQVLDDTTIAIPERPGNRRADSYHNILANPRVGLLFVVPGRPDTLRVNGRARLVSDAPFFDDMVVKGHRPKLAVVVEIEEVYFHCAKAYLRSKLWKPETWNPDALPSRAQISKSLERVDEPLENLERYYGPQYADKIYTD
ncbi:pyridoxamine 5'-phosphate oxidase family protein [Streptomyces sp. T-3]|nr:pyridoxamine 5'-phosphate oxidase family protein [Streptomyces sp. T-3]